MNKFCEIIYHPSRFVPPVCINILIYRYLNGVIDASKTEKSITLSLTIWGYPSRFSHYTLSDTKEATLRNVPQLVLYGIWEGQLQIWLSIKVTVSWYETFCSIPWNCLFQAEKHFVSPCETSRYVSVLWLPHRKEFCFTRKRIRFLLHNYQQKNVRDNPKSWWIAWWIL